MSDSAFPAYKALAFNSTQQALKKMVGPDVHAKFLAAVSDATRDVILNPRPATEWIPLERLDDTYRQAFTVCFGGDREGMFRLGRTKFTNDLQSIYKVFIRILHPATVLGRAPTVFSTYMRNNGRAVSGKLESNRCWLSWEDIRIGSTPFWEVQRGMAHAAAEATRMRDVKTKFTRGGGNEASSEIEIVWS